MRLGFLPQIRQIMRGLPKERQTLLSIIAFGSVIWIVVVIGVIFWVVGYSALDAILNFLGAKTAESMAASHEYAFWILLGLPFTILGTSLTPIVRADGAPKVAMVSGLSGCLLNIVLDWLFIFPLGMGVAGAAIATTIGNVVAAAIADAFCVPTWKRRKRTLPA